RSGVLGGWARVSVSTNATSSTAATANAVRATPSPQPFAAARMNPYTSAATPTVEAIAPARSNRPGSRGVSVTNSGVAAITARPTGTLTNSTQRQASHWGITPP